MTKNITLRLDAALLKQAKRAALEEDKSVSQWVGELIAEAVAGSDTFEAAKRRALRRLDMGFDLGGKPLTRDEAHER